jgi:hypothetical protein
MKKSRLLLISFATVITALVLGIPGTRDSIVRQKPREASSALDAVKSHGNPRDRLIPDELLLEVSGLNPASLDAASYGNGSGAGTNRGNAFVNDPCLDPAPTAPFPENFRRTVQSETEIAVLNSLDEDDDDGDEDQEGDSQGDRLGFDGNRHGGDGENDDDHHGNSSGRLMVAGYNDSFGFYDNRQGLSGFSYSTDGGKQWIDGGGLPPRVPSGVPSGTLGSDAYFGDPVVQVHHRTRTFYYASIYQNAAGFFTLSVNRGEFKVAPRQSPVESFANTRCEANPALHGVPDPPAFVRERIIWEPPVEAIPPPFLNGGDDFLDKEWLYVNQETGFLYMTYTRFGADGSTPLELVRSFDGGQTWTPPTIVVPNLDDTFNQATQAVVTPTGRVIVSWHARTFPAPTFVEREQRIEAAFSDNCSTPAPCTFGVPVIVDFVNPQREPPGYNRGRAQILNAPYMAVDKGRDDGVITSSERRKPGFGNVYITYFDGRTPLAQAPNPPTRVFLRQGDILLSRSTNNGATYSAPVKVNDDPGDTSHVFPSVHVNKHAEVFVTWLDRRLDRPRNLLTDTWGDISGNRGASFGTDGRLSTVSTDWITREDARPDYGDYNSGEVIKFQHFASIWADGRFPTPAPLTEIAPGVFSRPSNRAATPDTLFAIVKRGGSSDRDRN